jgi:hypothetical protein
LQNNNYLCRTIKYTHILINTTKFLNALRLFEHIAESNYFQTELKIKVRKNLLKEIKKLKDQINEVDLEKETPEIIQGVRNALKEL